MYNGKRVLAMIPARGGSKEVPRKNIRDVGGKPLIAWTIEAAKSSKYVDMVIVSTDDDEIAAVAKEWGAEVPFMRPKELANDAAPITAPALHALEHLPGFGYLATLQPTVPMRTAAIIDNCLEYMVEKDAPACATMTEPAHKPYWMYHIGEDGRIDPLMKEIPTARQLFRKYHTLNGAIYLVDTQWFLESNVFLCPETIAFMMSQKDSIDIDNEFELEIADIVLRKTFNGK